MAALVYGFTTHGVMVQVHYGAPSDNEWTEMLGAIERRSKTLKAGMAVVRGDASPSSKQREALARTLKETRPDLRFALLTDSRVARGVLTALNWLTGKGNTSAAFPSQAVEEALTFMQLAPEEKAAVRSMLKTLESGSAEQTAALR